MYRLLLAVAALALTAGPAFAQSQDLAPPGKGPLLEYKYTQAPFSEAQSLVLLYDNGPIQTGTGNGAGGANTSAIQSSYGSTLFGSGHALATTSVADDFTVPAGGWTISDMDFFSYQTGGNPTTSTFTGVYVQIWNGRPGDAGSTVVFGDLTTNRLASSTFSGIYRVTETTLTNAQRPVWRNNATIGTTLAAGTYWVQWASTGSLASGPWVPPVTLAGSPTPPVGNARQFTISTSAWADALDGMIVVALPFVVNGTAGAPAGPAISATPGSLAFGTVAVGTTTAPQTVTLTNSGIGTLTVASITGSGAPFTVNTAGTSFSLAAGASTTFTVTFSPTAATASAGTVTITSNAPSSPTTVTLSGTGNADVTTQIPPGDTTGDPTFNRPNAAGGAACTLSGFATASAYETRPFSVATAGSYTITTDYSGTPDFDGYLHLYAGSFDPTAPCTNLVVGDDDFVLNGGSSLAASQIAAQTLTAGNYILVVSGYDNTEFGTYVGTVVGPGAATFGGAPTPSLSVTPSAVAFGSVNTGATATQVVTITNTGGTTINLASVAYTGSPAITATAVAPGALAPGATRTTTLTFAPTAAGAVTGTLTVTSDAPGSPVTVAVTGTGTVPSGATTYPSTDTPLPITDNNPTGITSTLIVPAGAPAIADLNVSLDITHTWVGDLVVTLATGATTATLVDRPGTAATPPGVGCSANNMVVILDDGGTDGAIETSCTGRASTVEAYTAGGRYAPNGLLSAFNGPSATGTWTLFISDNAAQDTGTLNAWALIVQAAVAGEGGAGAVASRLVVAPNPVIGQGQIDLTVGTAQDVRVVLFDALGREVRVLLDRAMAAGQQAYIGFTTTDLPAGLYVVRASGTDVNLTQRVTVIR